MEKHGGTYLKNLLKFNRQQYFGKEWCSMKVQHIITKQGTPFYVLLDDNLQMVMPVCKYLKGKSITNCSINTIHNQAFHLKILFEYLEKRNMTYIDLVTPSEGKTVYDKLSDYRMYLLYKDYDENIIPIGGFKQQRQDITVNQMMSTVLTFYSELAIEENIPELNLFKETATIPHFHSFLNQMFLKKQKGKKNLLMSKVPQKLPKYITREQFNALWDICQNRRDRIILGLGFYGGLRISETIGLNLEDLRDINKNIIHITKRKDLDNPDAFVKYDSVGMTLIPDKLRNEIISYINEDLQGIDTNYFIINFYGSRQFKPMRKNRIDNILKSLGKKVGIDNLHSHMLRHGCAVDMLTHGVDMAAISDKLRHKSINTTANVYAKLDLSAKAEVQESYCKNIGETFKQIGIDLDEFIDILVGDDEDE